MTPKRNLILMTGTPLTTKRDVYGYCRFTNPNAYPSQAWFDADHVEGTDIFGAVTGWKNEDRMQKNFLYNAARAFRRELNSDLPDVIYEPIFYELEKEHKEAYDELAENALLELEGVRLDATTVQRLNTLLQQIIIGYEGFFATRKQKLAARKRVAGFELLDTVMDQLGDRKLIVFAYYQVAIQALLEHGEKYKAVALYGGLSDKARNQALDTFTQDPECRLLIGQPLSMGSGLDSLKTVCSDILFLELPMVAKDFTQAVGRIDRNGQTQTCHVRVATAEGTLQVRRQKVLLDKDEEAGEVQLTYKHLRDWIYGK